MIQLDNVYFNRAVQDLIYTVILPLLLLLIHTAYSVCYSPSHLPCDLGVFEKRVKLFKFRWGMTCQGCIVPCLNSRKPENICRIRKRDPGNGGHDHHHQKSSCGTQYKDHHHHHHHHHHHCLALFFLILGLETKHSSSCFCC